MNAVGAWLPIATTVLIVLLIVRSRVAWRPQRWTLPRRPPPRPKGTLIPFDREKLDDELSRLLREKR